MAQSNRHSHSKNRCGKNKIDNHVLIQREHIVSRVSSYFPNRRPLSYPNLARYMKKVHKVQTAQNATPIHKTIRIITELSPLNDQKYKITERGASVDFTSTLLYPQRLL